MDKRFKTIYEDTAKKVKVVYGPYTDIYEYRDEHADYTDEDIHIYARPYGNEVEFYFISDGGYDSYELQKIMREVTNIGYKEWFDDRYYLEDSDSLFILMKYGNALSKKDD